MKRFIIITALIGIVIPSIAQANIFDDLFGSNKSEIEELTLEVRELREQVTQLIELIKQNDQRGITE